MERQAQVRESVGRFHVRRQDAEIEMLQDEIAEMKKEFTRRVRMVRAHPG